MKPKKQSKTKIKRFIFSLVGISIIFLLVASAYGSTVYWEQSCNDESMWTVDTSKYTTDWQIGSAESIDGSSLRLYTLCTYYSFRPKIILSTPIDSILIPQNVTTLQYHLIFWVNLKVLGSYDSLYNSNNDFPAIYIKDETNQIIGGVAWTNLNTVRGLYGVSSVNYPIWHGYYTNSTLMSIESWHKYDILIKPSEQDVYIDGNFAFSSVVLRSDKSPTQLFVQNACSSNGESVIFFDEISITDFQYSDSPNGNGDDSNGSGWMNSIIVWFKSVLGENWFWWLIIILIILAVLLAISGGK